MAWEKGAQERGVRGAEAPFCQLHNVSLTIDLSNTVGRDELQAPTKGEKFAARRTLSEAGITLLRWSRQPISVKGEPV